MAENRQILKKFVTLLIISAGAIEILMAAEMDQTYAKFTNIKCECDPSFCKFTQCQVNDKSPTHSTIDFNFTVINPPVTNSRASVTYLRKVGNKYQTFPFSINLDVCDFLENSSQNPIVKQFYEVAKDYSNSLQKCPINDRHIYLQNFGPTYHPVFAFFPAGDFMIKGTQTVDGKLVTRITMWLEYRRPRNSFIF